MNIGVVVVGEEGLTLVHVARHVAVISVIHHAAGTATAGHTLAATVLLLMMKMLPTQPSTLSYRPIPPTLTTLTQNHPATQGEKENVNEKHHPKSYPATK